MKKVVLASVLSTVALSVMVDANAAASGTVCAAPTSAGSGSFSVDTSSTTEMVVNAFTPKCSANVHLVYDQAKAYFRVGSVSSAGSRTFRGSTAGGSVTSNATCSGTNCGSAGAVTARDSTDNPTSG
jgi:hypothetical protein